MKAYFYNDIPGDQRLAHDSGEAVTADTLASLGVVYKRIPIDEDGKWKGEIDTFAKERGYKNCRGMQLTGRHLHEDEEIRYILGGSGFFDVRGESPGTTKLTVAGGVDALDKRWIRIGLVPGDLIVLPPG
ncbi:hypothetical protein A1Q1_01928 [Trichosporon asahii var. asahii CBS 2479]|uniref:acireductone dioxygenase (Fe(2+)-requiring) n=1 Tax=Trichosporon asahii var. asahii (strain ATCC 90039 / CBS 2479 / JCM 2466 / KCTC 7840 / NBRC 103889/ NCYC 2677 / UAMH 7654) TaxID=1186058 RepID=J6F1J4_TRIAS|nr:hypothetical protein A1Q1_01928 [Trichosporon asahii var. asahii CBS 2479]EJT49017.1 hypothetical protein A1Q1_01928 [Trichosporon asahii var. asahii CBS 2479]